MNRVACAELLMVFRLQREVDHHDGVLFHDADQQDHPNQRNQAEFGARQQQRQQRAHRRRRQRREDGHRMDKALVEDTEHHIHGDQRRQNQPQCVAGGALKRRGFPLITQRGALRQLQLLPHVRDRPLSFLQRIARIKIEGDHHRGELIQPHMHQRTGALVDGGDRSEFDHAAAGRAGAGVRG